MSDLLSANYVYELIKGCLVSKRIAEICRAHLKYEYLSTDIQKKVVKYMFDTLDVMSTIPTLGMIGQQFNANKDIVSFLAKIRDIDVTGKEDVLLGAFEEYIKDVRFQRLHNNLASLYNEGKQNQAIELLSSESEAIANFSIKSKGYKEVFTQFDSRLDERLKAIHRNENAFLNQRCTWGVHEMDRLTGGGPQKGRSFLGMAVSGGSKSLYLKWCAIANARLGKKVAFFQGEDTEENAMTGFDAAWTGITTGNLEYGNIPDDKIDAIIKTRDFIKNAGGRIYVIAEEEFNKLYIEDTHETINDLIKLEGPIDMALYDYLEIMGTKGNWGKSESSERRRREDVANKLTQVATAHNIVVGSMTQAQDINYKEQNNPDFVMTRNHISEFKGAIKPFSYFFTFNQTRDEYSDNQLRIYFDKIRNHEAGKIVKIFQARESGRFYNAARTLAELGNNQSN